MYPGLLIASLCYALILAGIVAVPVLLGVAMALATKKAVSAYDADQPVPMKVLAAVVHGLSRKGPVGPVAQTD